MVLCHFRSKCIIKLELALLTRAHSEHHLPQPGGCVKSTLSGNNGREGTSHIVYFFLKNGADSDSNFNSASFMMRQILCCHCSILIRWRFLFVVACSSCSVALRWHVIRVQTCRRSDWARDGTTATTSQRGLRGVISTARSGVHAVIFPILTTHSL